MNIDTKEITVSKRQASTALSSAVELVITNADELSEATTLLSKIKTRQKEILDWKGRVINPIKEGLREFGLVVSPIENNISEAEKIVKQKMVDYQKKVDDAAAEKEKKIIKSLDEGNLKQETAIKKVAEIERVESTVRSDNGAAQFRDHVEVEIIDESKLPRKYLKPDVALINKDAKKGVEIPGVKATKVKIVAGYTDKTKDKVIGQ